MTIRVRVAMRGISAQTQTRRCSRQRTQRSRSSGRWAGTALATSPVARRRRIPSRPREPGRSMRRASSAVAMFILAAAAQACAPAPATTAPPAPPARPAPPVAVPTPPALRLPTTVEPTGYALRLEVDPDREGFRGHVDIDVRFTATADHVWLHAQAL